LTTILIYRNLGGAAPWGGHAFPRQRHMRRRAGYLFLSGFSSMYDAIHGWMTRWMDGWMKKASQKTTRTSFTTCNYCFFSHYWILSWTFIPIYGP
jgi:hypothetical protein